MCTITKLPQKNMSTTTSQSTSEASVKYGSLFKDREEIQIPVPYGHISGVWWGPKDRRPVLALHGWQDNAGTWDRLVPYILPEISVLAIDLPGHGLSSHYPPGMMYNLFWDGVYVVRRIAKYFKWSKVTIMGHSLGGAIGFLYAGVFPNDIDKLISIDIVSPTIREVSAVADKSSECVDKLLKYETLTSENMPNYTYKEMIDIVEEAYKGSVTRDSCEILMKRGMAPSPKGEGYYFARDVRLKVAGLGFISIELTMEMASRIRCDILNIKGKPGMHFDKAHYYNLILDKLRKNAHVEFHEIRGTHHLHLNNPESIKDLVNNFLKQPIKAKFEDPSKDELSDTYSV